MITLILSLLFIYDAQALAPNNKVKSEDQVYINSVKLYQQHNYFSALDIIAKKYINKSPEQNIKNYIEMLTEKTGTHYFNTYKDKNLRLINTPTTQLIMAKRNMYLKKYNFAHKRLDKFPTSHRFYAEAKLTNATVYNLEGSDIKAFDEYEKCINEASDWAKRSKNKIKRYFLVIEDTCHINMARIAFKKQNYQKALKHYNNIHKNSFIWPYTLLEKAWVYYYLKDYNRSLGLLITYNSPLLESYFTPEAEVLKALNYFELCLYEDALDIIQRYYDVYKPRSENLKFILNSEKGDSQYFFNLMFTPISETEQKNKFLRNVITQVSKRVKYNLDLNSLYTLNTEIVRSSPSVDMKRLIQIQQDLKEQINHYVKVSIYRLINDIHKFSYEMFNIKLEILARQRDLVYRDKKLISKRARGDLSQVTRTQTEEFWTFNNAFWADELGDYSFGLASNCKTVRNN